MVRATKLWVGLALVLAAGSAQAGLVVVDPDSVGLGDSLTTAFSGVTISQGDGSTGITAAVGVTGTQQFSINGDTGGFTYLPDPPFSTLADTLAASTDPSLVLRFDFDTATDFVSIDLIPNDSFDPASIAAFDAAGVLVGSATYTGEDLFGIRTTLSIGVPGIKTLLVGGFNGDNTDIDTMTFNLISAAAAPEPGTLALLGIGAVGMVLRTRRRRKGTPVS